MNTHNTHTWAEICWCLYIINLKKPTYYTCVCVCVYVSMRIGMRPFVCVCGHIPIHVYVHVDLLHIIWIGLGYLLSIRIPTIHTWTLYTFMHLFLCKGHHEPTSVVDSNWDVTGRIVVSLDVAKDNGFGVQCRWLGNKEDPQLPGCWLGHVVEVDWTRVGW